MLDICGLLCEYRDAPQNATVVTCLFEELYIVHCGKGKGWGAAMDWPLLWALHLVPNAQLNAADPVRKLEEELKLGKDLQLSITAGFGASKQGGRAEY